MHHQKGISLFLIPGVVFSRKKTHICSIPIPSPMLETPPGPMMFLLRIALPSSASGEKINKIKWCNASINATTHK